MSFLNFRSHPQNSDFSLTWKNFHFPDIFPWLWQPYYWQRSDFSSTNISQVPRKLSEGKALANCKLLSRGPAYVDAMKETQMIVILAF